MNMLGKRFGTVRAEFHKVQGGRCYPTRWIVWAVCLWLVAGSAGAEAPAFSYPQPQPTFSFPRDHGSHPDYKIEWWYITGHLFAEGDPTRRFGFQATFFRSASAQPGQPNAEPASAFAQEPFYLAHMALLDARTGRFIFQERLNRAGWDAAASTTTLAVRNGNWTLQFSDALKEQMALAGSIRSEAAFALQLSPQKPLTRFGESGFSRKGAEAHAASYYLTFTRLAATGTLQLGEEQLPVRGEAWMDHEISSSQLAPEQAGWDWAALQLHDGREIMAYRMRLKDGGTDKFSTLAWVNAQGQPQHFGPEQFTWRALSTWQSPATGATYPQEVEITAPDPQSGQRITFRLVPLVAAQELTGGLGGVAYWEGACRVLDAAGKEVGSAFMELTGYTGPIRALQGP